ncbi:MAG: M20/M25/M40 family metallo-hydrolase [Verrucomicrobiota bacterium]|nr:M20/M25/M40 family metallo-hydrolase [Verrucomicrobiota bacterium]
MTATELLETLVNTRSVSGEEARLADCVTTILQSDGFEVQRTGDSVWFTIAREEGPRLLLVSHLDTVPPCEGWNSDPFQLSREGEKLIGLGANDAKGCVAAMMIAARVLRDEEIDGSITFAFVAEEERGGAGMRAVKEVLPRIDAAIVGEPTSLEVCTAQRGMLILRCTAHGTSAHVAHPELGENAIHKAARDITRLAEMKFAHDHSLGATRAHVTQITGGMARNQVPDRCEFFVDLRTTPNLDHDEVTAAVDAALESEVAVHSARYLPVATDESEPIVRAALQAAGREHGIGSATASDWAFLKEIPTVKIGPGDTNRSHRPNEYLLVHELETGAAFYQRAVRSYFELVAKENAHA